LGYTNLYAYDAARRKICETNADGQILRYTNSPAGDLLSLTDGKGQTTQWHYDLYGRVTNKLDQAGTVILKYQYDADNRLTNRWSAAKNNTGYAYDHVGNLTNVAYPVSPAQRYQYDALNRLTNMVDAVGTTAYTYTSGGFLHTEDGPFASDTVTNYYNNRLRVGLGLQQPTGSWTNGFTYDEAKRLTSVTSPAGTFNYYYDSTRLGLVDQLSLPNSSYISNTYDPVARLLSTLLNNSSSTTLDSASYGYNVGNQRTNFLNATGTNVVYTYDHIGQLTNATSTLSAENRGYKYDSGWNLTNLNVDGTTTIFGVTSKNELSSVGSLYFDYDSNGNLTSSFTISGTIIITTYGYDDENRLISVETDEDTTPVSLTTFVYDGLGRMREQLQWTSSAGEDVVVHGAASPDISGGWSERGGIFYIYDGKRVIEERDTNDTPTVSYTRGNDLSGTLEGAGGIGGMLARSSSYSSGSFTTNLYYHADGNGNITYLVNSSQTLAASYRYDPYGNLLPSSGAYATANTYRFSSKEYSPSTSLYIYLYRFYSPSLQRWINRDPIQEMGGLNLYRPMGNDPLGFVDPLGLDYHYTPPGYLPSGPFHYLSGDTVFETGLSSANNLFACIFNGVASVANAAGSLISDTKLALMDAGVDPQNIEDASMGLAVMGFPEGGLPELVPLADATAGLNAAENTVTRYVGATEARIAQETGFIPNVDRFGQSKVVYVTPEAPVTSASQAESIYQIGSQNPMGATGSPTHVIVGNSQGVSFINGGNVAGSTQLGTELLTTGKIPVISVRPIGGH